MPGYLVGADGKRMPLADLSRLLGEPVDNIERLLKELKERRVYSLDRKGRIFSRRMIREQDWEQKGRESANLRWGNNGENQGVRDNPNGAPKPNPITREKNKETEKRKKEGADGPRGDFFGKPSPKRSTKKPWTLDQKRSYGWNKIAEALGNTAEAWSLIEAAANGNADARRICKAKAKDIDVTWYDGKPETGT